MFPPDASCCCAVVSSPPPSPPAEAPHAPGSRRGERPRVGARGCAPREPQGVSQQGAGASLRSWLLPACAVAASAALPLVFRFCWSGVISLLGFFSRLFIWFFHSLLTPPCPPLPSLLSRLLQGNFTTLHALARRAPSASFAATAEALLPAQETFLETGASDTRRTPLLEAAAELNPAAALSFVKAGADVLARDRDGNGFAHLLVEAVSSALGRPLPAAAAPTAGSASGEGEGGTTGARAAATSDNPAQKQSPACCGPSCVRRPKAALGGGGAHGSRRASSGGGGGGVPVISTGSWCRCREAQLGGLTARAVACVRALSGHDKIGDVVTARNKARQGAPPSAGLFFFVSFCFCAFLTAFWSVRLPSAAGRLPSIPLLPSNHHHLSRSLAPFVASSHFLQHDRTALSDALAPIAAFCHEHMDDSPGAFVHVSAADAAFAAAVADAEEEEQEEGGGRKRPPSGSAAPVRPGEQPWMRDPEALALRRFAANFARACAACGAPQAVSSELLTTAREAGGALFAAAELPRGQLLAHVFQPAEEPADELRVLRYVCAEIRALAFVLASAAEEDEPAAVQRQAPGRAGAMPAAGALVGAGRVAPGRQQQPQQQPPLSRARMALQGAVSTLEASLRGPDVGPLVLDAARVFAPAHARQQAPSAALRNEQVPSPLAAAAVLLAPFTEALLDLGALIPPRRLAVAAVQQAPAAPPAAASAKKPASAVATTTGRRAATGAGGEALLAQRRAAFTASFARRHPALVCALACANPALLVGAGALATLTASTPAAQQPAAGAAAHCCALPLPAKLRLFGAEAALKAAAAEAERLRGRGAAAACFAPRAGSHHESSDGEEGEEDEQQRKDALVITVEADLRRIAIDNTCASAAALLLLH